MQAEGIAQGRCSYFDIDYAGKIVSACALGALVLGSGRENEYLAHDLDAREVCPDLERVLPGPGTEGNRRAIEIIWNINDGWWITPEMQARAIYINDQLTVPIPVTIAYLKENGL